MKRGHFLTSPVKLAFLSLYHFNKIGAMYLIFSSFTSRLIFLLATNKASDTSLQNVMRQGPCAYMWSDTNISVSYCSHLESLSDELRVVLCKKLFGKYKTVWGLRKIYTNLSLWQRWTDEVKWNFANRRLMNTTVHSAWNYYTSPKAHKDRAISFEVISDEFKALRI